MKLSIVTTANRLSLTQNSKYEAKSHSPIYGIWAAMIRRCENPNTDNYVWYGGRGITVCDEWRTDSSKFISWAQEKGWTKGLKLDRIDNNGNYCPANCQFVDHKTNTRNRRDTVWIEYKGQMRKLADVCEELNLPLETIRRRRARGWKDAHLFVSI